jgi:hypothetical protein
VEDIVDPKAYTLQEFKLRAEKDKQILEAENKKRAKVALISNIRQDYQDLIEKMANWPAHLQIARTEIRVDPSLMEDIGNLIFNNIKRTRTPG